MLSGKIIICPNIEGILLVSERGGDFKLTLGQDLSPGYESHDQKEVEMYFTESFTFQIIDPPAFCDIRTTFKRLSLIMH